MIETLREHYRPSKQISAYHYRPAHANPSPVSEGRTEAMQSTHGNTRATDIRQSVLALEEAHYWDTVAKA